MKIRFKFFSNKFFNFVSGVILGVVASYIYSYIERPSISYNIDSIKISQPEVLNSTQSDFFVSISGKKFTNLKISTITITNDGGTILERNTAVEKNPLRITGIKPKLFFLDEENTKTSSIIKLKETAHKDILINFDYLNKNDVIVIKLISEENLNDDISVKGSFKNIRNISKNNSKWEKLKKLPLKIIVFLALGIIGLFVTIYMILAVIEYIYNKLKKIHTKKTLSR